MTGLERLPNRREFKRWVPRLKDVLWECEHYKVYEDPKVRSRSVENVAVVVLRDGRAFVGRAKCGKGDQYSSKRGFAVAMGRALRWADVVANHKGMYAVTEKDGEQYYKWRAEDFKVEPLVGGIELRAVCRVKVGL